LPPAGRRGKFVATGETPRTPQPAQGCGVFFLVRIARDKPLRLGFLFRQSEIKMTAEKTIAQPSSEHAAPPAALGAALLLPGRP